MRKLIKIILTIVAAIMVNQVAAQYSAVRVNALGIVTGTLNAGVDVAVADKWSVDVSAY